MRPLVVLLSACVLAFLVVSCSKASGDKEATQTPSPTDDVVASTLLLDSSDFPEGWVNLPWNQQAMDDFRAGAPWERCHASMLPGEVDRAYGGEYSDANTTLLSINPAIYVFDSAASAEAGVDSLIGEYECFADVVGKGIDIDEQFAFGETNVEALAADQFGANSAIRVSNTQVYKTSDPPNTDVLFFDVTYVVSGAIVSEVTGFQRHNPIDEDLLATYVEKARLKIQ